MHKFDYSHYVGRKFGQWEILRLVGRRDEGTKRVRMIVWCRCACGLEKEQILHNLIAGNTSSCRACAGLNRRELLGRRFGSLVVLEYVEYLPKNFQWVMKCQCDCGNISYPRNSNLTSGRTQSCGCRVGQGVTKADWCRCGTCRKCTHAQYERNRRLMQKTESEGLKELYG